MKVKCKQCNAVIDRGSWEDHAYKCAGPKSPDLETKDKIASLKDEIDRLKKNND